MTARLSATRMLWHDSSAIPSRYAFFSFDGLTCYSPLPGGWIDSGDSETAGWIFYSPGAPGCSTGSFSTPPMPNPSHTHTSAHRLTPHVHYLQPAHMPPPQPTHLSTHLPAYPPTQPPPYPHTPMPTCLPGTHACPPTDRDTLVQSSLFAVFFHRYKGQGTLDNSLLKYHSSVLVLTSRSQDDDSKP